MLNTNRYKKSLFLVIFRQEMKIQMKGAFRRLSIWEKKKIWDKWLENHPILPKACAISWKKESPLNPKKTY